MDNKTPRDHRLSLYSMKTPLLLALLLWGLTTRPQQSRPTADRHRLFNENANALPRLYANKDFDSIGLYIQLRWQEPVDPDLLCQAILLSIQRNIFSLTDFSELNSLTWPLISQLNAYANLLASCQNS